LVAPHQILKKGIFMEQENMQESQEEEDSEEYQQKLRDAAEQILSGNFKIRDYYGLSDGALEYIYMVGHEMFAHKQYDKAKNVLSLLVALEPTSIKYSSACGVAHFMAEEYENAMSFFRIALLSGDYTPKGLMRLAECAVRLDDAKLASNYLEEVLHVAGSDKFKNDKESSAYTERAKMMLSMLKSLKEKAKSKEDNVAETAEQKIAPVATE
jgi:predicted Zn-dependent protease